MNNLYDIEMLRLDGNALKFSTFYGKVLFIVNVASKCSFTLQYKMLQDLYEKYESEGFEVIGVPCNQFWAQEPGSNDEIASFCEANYSVRFTLTEKVDVNEHNKCQLYDWLTNEKSKKPGEISWNFEKFLIDKLGNVIDRFTPETSPCDKLVIESIEKALRN